jgi:uncharacterized membrane protein YeiH
MDTFLIIIESICVVAFAISGALVAIDKKMDIFGVTILGLTTSIGGGIIRDLILDITPPMSLRHPRIAIIAIVTSLIFFIPFIRKKIQEEEKIYNVLMFITDSLGLGLFTVIGVQTAINNGFADNYFLQVFVGVLSGVGGGVLRDVLAGNRPYIFIKHFYATAALIGAIVCVVLWNILGSLPSMLISAAIIFILRVLAAHYHWELPKA